MKEERKQKLAEGTRIFLSGQGRVLELTGATE